VTAAGRVPTARGPAARNASRSAASTLAKYGPAMAHARVCKDARLEDLADSQLCTHQAAGDSYSIVTRDDVIALPEVMIAATGFEDQRERDEVELRADPQAEPTTTTDCAFRELGCVVEVPADPQAARMGRSA